MRRITNYFRQLFCKHEFEKEEGWCNEVCDFGGRRRGEKIFMYCAKCGYYKSFWKF